MADGAFADIGAINDLENGIRTFGHQMADANSEIERNIDVYFQDFERGLRILEERLRKAEEELERAERALERQRNKRVLVRDSDGKGWHWEQADCSAEEARVARCQAIRDKCKRDVDECRNMISDARSKRHIHEAKYATLEGKLSEAIEKIGPVKELVEKHRATQVPSSSPSSGSSGSSRPFGSFGSFPSFSSPASTTTAPRGTEIPRPRPPMPSGTTYGPKASPVPERPRSPQDERVKPAPSRPVTDADRPRSPFGDTGRVTRDSVSSFKEGIDKIINKHKDDKDE